MPEKANIPGATAAQQAAADEALEKALRGDEDEARGDDPKMQAFAAFREVAFEYPRSTPDEHTIFGFGGKKVNLGQLRDLTGIR